MDHAHGFPPMEDALLSPFERMQRALARADYDLRYRRKLQDLRLLQMLLFKFFMDSMNSNKTPKDIIINNTNSIFTDINLDQKSDDKIFALSSSSIAQNKQFFEENFSKKIQDAEINKDLNNKDYNFKTVAAINGFYPTDIEHNGLETSEAASLSFKALLIMEMTELTSPLSNNYDDSLSLSKNIEVQVLSNPGKTGYPNIITAFLSDNQNMLASAVTSESVMENATGAFKHTILNVKDSPANKL
jgi:hypothetical protein